MPFNTPVEPVLSVLSTAAPASFASEIAQNPTFAASFELALDAGGTPDWFGGLPTDVQKYLETYVVYVSAATTGDLGTTSPLTSTSSRALSTDSEAPESQPTLSSSIATVVTSSNSLVPTSSTNPNNSDPSNDRLAAGAKIGIGIGVLLGSVIIIMLAVLLWRIDRRRRTSVVASPRMKNKRRRRGLLYLQRKPELDAEEQTRSEVAANTVQQELEAEEKHELDAATTQEGCMDAFAQELRSEECAGELEAARGNGISSAQDEKIDPITFVP